ncbi:lysylphosphatidylglycerol synthase transmembrane domain-containing protein [Dictyoglomus turgidum]|jgi:uncharacterized protein (TIRG00374 family)|uniref:lysylphosphatidylglycerol synthase transmembrane domain-containing protein n=1 Tax=Dictyoglomus turgidum TaxID=513050 RepID=UPI000CCF301F|nr:lysylphosphatidylglycerol synthase transmembrane domain-containing protein [Dictyoglomus turgidum]PNV80556.1 MAG: TIGR00374 family protein [Dictyoglomus turgidum]
MKDLSSTIKSGLKISLIITTIVFVVILFITTDSRTWEALKSINGKYLIYVILLNTLSWIWSGIRYSILIRGIEGVNLNLIEALQIHLSYYFASSITPTSAGGEPLEIYLLSKKNIKIGQATALSLFRYVINTLTFAIASPLIIYFYSYLFPQNIVRKLVQYSAILFLLVVGGFLFALFKPRPIIRLVSYILIKLRRIPFLKRIHPFKILRVVNKTVRDFHNTLWFFLKEKKLTILGFFFFNLLSWITYFLIAPVLMSAFNLKVNYLSVVLVQIPIFFMMFYVPSPGGSGAIEILISLGFAPFVPKYILGIFIILWRTLTHYLTLLAGAIVLVYILGVKNW